MGHMRKIFKRKPGIDPIKNCSYTAIPSPEQPQFSGLSTLQPDEKNQQRVLMNLLPKEGIVAGQIHEQLEKDLPRTSLTQIGPNLIAKRSADDDLSGRIRSALTVFCRSHGLPLNETSFLLSQSPSADTLAAFNTETGLDLALNFAAGEPIERFPILSMEAGNILKLQIITKGPIRNHEGKTSETHLWLMATYTMPVDEFIKGKFSNKSQVAFEYFPANPISVDADGLIVGNVAEMYQKDRKLAFEKAVNRPVIQI